MAATKTKSQAPAASKLTYKGMYADLCLIDRD